MSGERIKDCITALKAFDLQGVFSMTPVTFRMRLNIATGLLWYRKMTAALVSALKSAMCR